MSRTQTIWAIVISVIILIGILIYFRKTIFKILLTPVQEYFIIKLHPKKQDRFRKFISRVEKETDYNVIITSGYRTFSEQVKIHNDDPKNPEAGYSMHNYGLAMDINATNGTNYLRKASSKEDWELSGIPRIAREMGFSWGGDFKTYHDPVHIGFDRAYDVDELRLVAINQFGNNWDDIEGNKINIA